MWYNAAMTLIYAIGFVLPFAAGFFFYSAKFVWLALLSRARNPWHDPTPIRYWFFFAGVCATIGLMWTTSGDFDPSSSSIPIGIFLFVLMFTYAYLALYHRRMLDVFEQA